MLPGRSVVDISVETMAQVARHPNIIGVKDATGDIQRVTQHRRAIGSDFIQLSGEDASALGYNAHGGTGVISVSSNAAPALCAALQAATLEGRWDEARDLNDRLQPLHEVMFGVFQPGTGQIRRELAGSVFRRGAPSSGGVP